MMGASIFFFSKESVDFVAVSILAAVLTGVLVSRYFGLGLAEIVGFVEFEPLMYIFGMSVVAFVAEKERIFQVLAVLLIKATRGNERQLFWVTCVVSTISAAFIADVTVSIIFVPIIIRTCKILKIKAGTYLMGMTVCINLGSLITPFSSGENILIVSHFDLDLAFFARNTWGLFAVMLVATLGLLDLLFLSKEERGPLENKLLLLEILNPSLVITNRRSFYKNSAILAATFVAILFVEAAFLVVLAGAMLFVLLNEKYRFKEVFKSIEWEILFFLACLFVMIGALTSLGLMEFLGEIVLKLVANNYVGAILLVLLLSSVLSAFLANTPTTLVFLPIVSTIAGAFPQSPVPLYLALLIGVNLGGNFIPQGAACDMMTLQLAKEAGVEDMNYRRLLKQGAAFALLHLGIAAAYLLLFAHLG